MDEKKFKKLKLRALVSLEVSRVLSRSQIVVAAFRRTTREEKDELFHSITAAGLASVELGEAARGTKPEIYRLTEEGRRYIKKFRNNA